jgi:group I intron endonuclease
MIVYKITNAVNGKVYIGITKCNLSKRWAEHKCKSKSLCSHLYLSIKKYGINSFKIETIFEAISEKELYEKEIEFISFYKSNNPSFGYNNSIGGEKSSFGKKLSQEQKDKISQYQKNRKRSAHKEETKKIMSALAKGRDMKKAIESSVKARKGKPSKNKVPVHQYTLNGIFVKKFNSYTEAAKEINGTTSAFTLLKTGRLKTYKSFLWKF